MAMAAKNPPTAEELARIKTGYENLTYLLDNFEKETTICKENGGECKRDADPVRKYLGLRSTQDPLFQIEKVFDKVKYMDLDPDQLEPFFEATEEWNTAQNMSNSMAFISQFGEYNPGGGKEEVLKYLEESKKQVIIAKDALEKIIKTLGL
jgi:Ca2+ transporting ATPase